MATETEKVIQRQEVELTRLQGVVVTLEREVAQLRPLAGEVVALRAELAARDGDSEKLRAVEADMAVIKHQLAEFSKTKDTWGSRVWQIVTVVLAAFFATLTAILATLLTFTLNAKK